MDALYATGGILLLWLGSLVAAYFAGVSSVADDLRSERGRADRAEALAETRRVSLVEASKRALRARAAGQDAANAAGRIDVALAGGAAPGADLGDLADELLRAAGHGPGGPGGEAGAPGAAATEGDGRATEGVGLGGGLG